MNTTTDTQTKRLIFPKVAKCLLDALKADGMEIDNKPSKHDASQGHVQLLSNKLTDVRGTVYYVSDEETDNNMGEPSVRKVHHWEFDLEDMVGTMIFIKYKEQNKGKIWKFVPTVKVETLSTFPKSTFGRDDNSIKSQLTFMQKRFLDKIVEMENDGKDVWCSTILVNKKNFVVRDGHEYMEVYWHIEQENSRWVYHKFTSKEELSAPTPGFILDKHNNETTVHIYNPYYFK